MASRHLAKSAAVGGNNRNAAGQRLGRGHRPSFVFGGMNEDVRSGVNRREVRVVFYHARCLNHIAFEAEFADDFVQWDVALVGPKQQQPVGPAAFLANLRECLDQHRDVAPLGSFADEQQIGPVRAEKACTRGGKERLVRDWLKGVVGALIDDGDALVRHSIMFGDGAPGALARHDDSVGLTRIVTIEPRIGLTVKPAVRLRFGLVDAMRGDDERMPIKNRRRIGWTE